MELYDKVLKIVDSNIIYCLIPMILTLILIENIFKNKFPTKSVLNLIRWVIISYTIVTLLHFIFVIVFYQEQIEFIKQASKSNKVIIYFVIFSSTILPFILLAKKIALNFGYVLLIAVCMKIGVYIERFVIITTSIHRDYAPESNYLWLEGFTMKTLQSIILVLLTLGILKIIQSNESSSYLK